MLLQNKKNSPSAQRAAERREREEQAPRLSTKVQGLKALRIAIEDRHALGTTKHVRHVMVARAPALFVIPCGDAVCDSPGHDITSAVMRALSMRLTAFEGESGCDGNVGTAVCSRVLHFRLEVQYEAD